MIFTALKVFTFCWFLLFQVASVISGLTCVSIVSHLTVWLKHLRLRSDGRVNFIKSVVGKVEYSGGID